MFLILFWQSCIFSFCENDFEGFKIKIKEFWAMIQKKYKCKSKLEDQFPNHDKRSAWQELNKMMGRDSKGVHNDIINKFQNGLMI